MSDIRKQRTLNNIDDAIYNLLGQMSFADITVTKICQKAILGRSTFYQYYFDKYEWLEKQVALYSQKLEKLLDQRFANHRLAMDLESLLNELWADHVRLSLLFAVHTPEADLSENFQNLLSKYFTKTFTKTSFDADEFDFLSHLYGSVVFTNIKWSMTNGISSSINKLMDTSVQSFMARLN